jgi:hypothetical protein
MTDQVIEIVETIADRAYKLNRDGATIYCVFGSEAPESIIKELSAGAEVPLSTFKKYMTDGYLEYLSKNPPELWRIISQDLFLLPDKDFNSPGLQEYSLRVGGKLGVSVVCAKNIETADYVPAEKRIYLPMSLLDENLSEQEYRGIKGLIDHEFAHVLWPDMSYLEFSDERFKQHVHAIGNIIDDIRIERRMAEKYNIDSINFRYFCESSWNKNIEQDRALIKKDAITSLSLLVSIYYREVSISVLEKPIEYALNIEQLFNEEIKPVMDDFIFSNGKGADAAIEILDILSQSFNVTI